MCEGLRESLEERSRDVLQSTKTCKHTENWCILSTNGSSFLTFLLQKCGCVLFFWLHNSIHRPLRLYIPSFTSKMLWHKRSVYAKKFKIDVVWLIATCLHFRIIILIHVLRTTWVLDSSKSMSMPSSYSAKKGDIVYQNTHYQIQLLWTFAIPITKTNAVWSTFFSTGIAFKSITLSSQIFPSLYVMIKKNNHNDN